MTSENNFNYRFKNEEYLYTIDENRWAVEEDKMPPISSDPADILLEVADYIKKAKIGGREFKLGPPQGISVSLLDNPEFQSLDSRILSLENFDFNTRLKNLEGQFHLDVKDFFNLKQEVEKQREEIARLRSLVENVDMRVHKLEGAKNREVRYDE